MPCRKKNKRKKLKREKIKTLQLDVELDAQKALDFISQQ